MKKLFTNAAIIMIALVLASVTNASAQGYGIVFGELEVTAENAGDIFGDGMASYHPEQNMLELQDGFDYHLSHGKVSIDTGNDFIIRLNGDAEIYACVECSSNLFLESSGAYCLKITSNISGSALKCQNLTIPANVSLDLLSRNSQENMYALDCAESITVNGGTLSAEVTTASLAVKTVNLFLTDSFLSKPRGGNVNPSWGGICFADGVPAKVVWIVPGNDNGVDEYDSNVSGKTVQKIFENGRIVIIKDGIRYNVVGQKID